MRAVSGVPVYFLTDFSSRWHNGHQCERALRYIIMCKPMLCDSVNHKSTSPLIIHGDDKVKMLSKRIECTTNLLGPLVFFKVLSVHSDTVRPHMKLH